MIGTGADDEDGGVPGSATLPAAVAAEAVRHARAALPPHAQHSTYAVCAEAVAEDPASATTVCAVYFVSRTADAPDAATPPVAAVPADEEDAPELALCRVPPWARPATFVVDPQVRGAGVPLAPTTATAAAAATGAPATGGRGRGGRGRRGRGARGKRARTAERAEKGYTQRGEPRKRRESGLQTPERGVRRDRDGDVCARLTVMDETCGEVVYKNGQQMIRNMSCHRCKNRKTLCHLCTQSVFHRVCACRPTHTTPTHRRLCRPLTHSVPPDLRDVHAELLPHRHARPRLPAVQQDVPLSLVPAAPRPRPRRRPAVTARAPTAHGLGGRGGGSGLGGGARCSGCGCGCCGCGCSHGAQTAAQRRKKAA